MAENTNIEWCDSTFNPWEGCQKVGPGCDHCYAETRNARFGGGTAINWGPGAPRRRTSAQNWNKPLQWNRQHDAFFAEHGRRRRVFCASLADVFDNEVDLQWRTDLFNLIERTPNLDWLILTKRIGNVHGMMPLYEDLHRNIWLGITVVNQAEADRDIPKLLAVPAAKRFISMEPLLGPVDIARWIATANVTCKDCGRSFWLHDADPCEHQESGSWTLACPQCGNCKCRPGWTPADARTISMEPPADWIERKVGRFDHVHPTISIRSAIDWVIVGGESGPNARPMHPHWARSLRDQCESAGVPFLFKQWGDWLPGHHYTTELQDRDSNLDQSRYESAEFDEAAEWDIGYRLACETGDEAVYRVGKKASGRLLDGRTWDGYPEVSA